MPPTERDNSLDLTPYRGPVRKCEYCRPEQNLLGRACQWCYSQGYLTTCLNCKGTGKTTTGSVWDGGRSQYTATCNICGGKGCFPARAADYARQQASTPPPAAAEPSTPPVAVRPMPHLDIQRR